MSLAPSRLATAASLALLCLGAHAAKPAYTIVDLGVVGGATASQAFGVSPDGATVVGRGIGDSTTGNPAFVWTEATGSVALPNIRDRIYAQANGVNAAGVIVGTSTNTWFGSGAVPVMWQGGAVSKLKLPQGQAVGRANAINAAGLAVGSIGSDTSERGVIFDTATGTTKKAITATTANGSYMSYALGINDAGLIVGGGIDPNDAALNVGMVYDAATDTMGTVGALPGANGALAFGVSNAGHVVGSSMQYQGSGMPFVWTSKGGMVAIPLPPKTGEGIAYGVNSNGWVVGVAGGLYAVPFLYVKGKTYALASLLPANSGWDLNHNTSSSAEKITDQGTIVGTGVHDGQTHAYVMTLVKARRAERP